MSKTDIRSVVAGFHFSFIETWSDWMPWNIGKMNWRTFTFAHVDVEFSGNRFELTVVLLGLGFTFDWWDPAEVEHLNAVFERAIEVAEDDR